MMHPAQIENMSFKAQNYFREFINISLQAHFYNKIKTPLLLYCSGWNKYQNNSDLKYYSKISA